MARDPICGMNVEEGSGLKLLRDNREYYFCSRHCLEKFAQKYNIDSQKLSTCLIKPKAKWYKNKTIIVAAALICACLLSYMLPVLVAFRLSLLMYLHRIWWAIVLGLFLGGVIEF